MFAEDAEYGRAIHCDATSYEPLQGNGADTRDVGRENVVVEGGTVPGRSRGGDGIIRIGGGDVRDRGRCGRSSMELRHGTM